MMTYSDVEHAVQYLLTHHSGIPPLLTVTMSVRSDVSPNLFPGLEGLGRTIVSKIDVRVRTLAQLRQCFTAADEQYYTVDRIYWSGQNDDESVKIFCRKYEVEVRTQSIAHVEMLRHELAAAQLYKFSVDLITPPSLNSENARNLHNMNDNRHS